MSSQGVEVAIPAEVHMIDETGFVWTVLEESADPARVQVVIPREAPRGMTTERT